MKYLIIDSKTLRLYNSFLISKLCWSIKTKKKIIVKKIILIKMEKVTKTNKKVTFHHDPRLIKTKLCRTWLATGKCPYRDCVFAHGESELRNRSNGGVIQTITSPSVYFSKRSYPGQPYLIPGQSYLPQGQAYLPPGQPYFLPSQSYRPVQPPLPPGQPPLPPGQPPLSPGQPPLPLGQPPLLPNDMFIESLNQIPEPIIKRTQPPLPKSEPRAPIGPMKTVTSESGYKLFD